MTERFDALIVGAGQAGPPLAGRLAAAGLSVALVERGRVGGTCVNTGCTPTKTLVASAAAAHGARRAADFGVTVGGPVGVDMVAVRSRKDAVVRASRARLEAWLGGLRGFSLIRGQARFVSPSTLAVGDRRLTADRIFLDVGARASVPDWAGLGAVRFLTSTTLLDLDRLPRHLVVVGGGSVGLEFAQVFRRFGAEVTLVEKGPRLLGREDDDVSKAVRAFLEREGIAVRCDADCIRFEPRGSDMAVRLVCRDGSPEVVGSHVLLAVGRRPNTDDLGLDAAGIATDERGYVLVNDELRTSAPGVWALGDCNGRGAFTHTAYNDFEIVAANLLDGASRRLSERVTGYAVYTDPPLGRVGLTERDARAAGHQIRVGLRPMTRVARAVEKGETQGFMKLIVDGETDQILGAAILGTGGDEAIHAVLIAMNAGVSASDYARAVPIHPTVSELIPTVLGEIA